jgi:sRNA-binding regulator protein Hfq
VNYLKELVSARTPVEVKLRDGATHSGTIEYWDQRFIRLTPASGANLFIFKHDIKYLLEK